MSNKTRNNEKGISFEKLRRITETQKAKIHFVGIGGVSMYSLARLALLGTAEISGSDREESDRTRELKKLGVEVKIGHNKDNVHGASVVVYTHAIAKDNCEILEAHNLQIPVVSRAEYMGALMLGYTNRIGVSGSHGKSSTVAMLDAIFSHAACDPTVLSGAALPIGEPLKVGSKNLMVYEACEYKDSFLRFAPTISVGLNLELDHTDYFESIGAMKESFKKALGKATRFSVINGDDVNFRSIIPTLSTEAITFGMGERNKYQYSITSFRDRGYTFVITKFGERVGEFDISVPGVFNVENAVAAIVTAIEYGIDVKTISEAIASYRGIPRRMEYVGMRYGRRVFYDYAHHPTEMRATINALKLFTHDTVTVIFKPHTYSRTKSLWEGFRMALTLAEHVILTEIYPAREEPIEGVDSAKMALEVGERAVFLSDDEIVPYLDEKTHGTIVIMGAGDLEQVKNDILNTNL